MLYKYLAPDRIDILENYHIRFTQAAAFNDPFEIKPHINSIAPEDELRRQLREMLPERLRQEYLKLPLYQRAMLSYEQFLAFADMQMKSAMPQALSLAKTLTPIGQTGIAMLADQLGILSLTETPDNLLMWAHYAASHEGFVIGVDERHSYFNCAKGSGDDLRQLSKVKCVGKRPSLPMTQLTVDDVLLTKSSQWAYENEWRIVRPLLEADKVIEASPHPIHLFSFPPEIIRTIILGYRMTAGTKAKIIQAISDKERYPDIEVLQATQDEQEYKVNFQKCNELLR